MEDNHYYYFCLNGYLSNADNLYVEGRFLWLNQGISGACNLIWLSIEQLITILIFESRIQKGSFDSVIVKNDGVAQELVYDPQEKDIDVIHTFISRTLYMIERRHRLQKLLDVLRAETAINLEEHVDVLEKTKEFHDRRYFENSSTSINLNLLNEIDRVFFLLRGYLSEHIPRSLIDEIAFQREFSQGHPLPIFSYAYQSNDSFSSRKHPVVNQILQDNRIIKNDGIHNELL